MSREKEPGLSARTLIYIPIIHSQVDMGGFGELIRQATFRKLGRVAWNRKMKWIEALWTRIEEVIDGLALEFEKVRLYQDGLPVCGREAQIVTELAQAGSRNHQLLLRLMNQGAKIMGTESSALLLEEYELEKRILSAGAQGNRPGPAARFQALSASLLQRRDRFIAERINETLLAGETGVLFLGMLHALEEPLADDLQVSHPIRPNSGYGGMR